MANSLKYKVVLIEEGMGNLGSCFYYPRPVLEQAVQLKIFEGKKCYADHPDAMEAQTRPERSIRDVVGHHENVHIESGPSGEALVVADLVLLNGPAYEWARTLVESSVGYAGKFQSDFIGLSINAGGDSQKKSIDDVLGDEKLPLSARPKLLKAKAEGVMELEYCTALTDAVSVDLVTEAGAKGRVLQMLESEKIRMSKKFKEDEKKPADQKKPDAPAGGEHADADQDKELIASMVKKYVGEGADESVHEAMKQALADAKEMGMEGEEAQVCAGNSMKMAKHKAGKEAKKKEADDLAAKEAKDAEEAAGKDGKMESDVKLNEKVSFLEAKVAQGEIKELIASELNITGEKLKAFLEKIGSPKTVAQAKESIKIFKLGMKESGEESVFVNPEKTRSGVEDTSDISFADCVRQ